MKKETILPKRKAFGTVLLLLLCITATAQDIYVVTATKLNVRKSASAESSIVGSLSKGDKVDVYNFKGGWAEIGFKNGTAFVSKKYLEKVESETTSQSKLPSTPAPEPQKKETQVLTMPKEKPSAASFDLIGSASFYFNFSRHSSYWNVSSDVGVIFTRTYGFLSFSSESCVFATGGLGLSYYSYSESFSYAGYSASVNGSSSTFLFPLRAGIRIGGNDGINGTLQAGLVPSFTLYSIANSETVHLSFGDRWGISGSIKATIAYKRYGLMAEYMFPFSSGTKGVFLYGVCIGF